MCADRPWCNAVHADGANGSHQNRWTEPASLSRSERLTVSLQPSGWPSPSLFLSISGQAVVAGNTPRGRRALIHAYVDADAVIDLAERMHSMALYAHDAAGLQRLHDEAVDLEAVFR